MTSCPCWHMCWPSATCPSWTMRSCTWWSCWTPHCSMEKVRSSELQSLHHKHYKQPTLWTKCKILLELHKLRQDDLPLTIFLHLLNPLPLCVHEQVATTWPAPTELCPWSGTSRRSRQPECWALKPETRSTSGTADAPPSALPRLLMTSR